MALSVIPASLRDTRGQAEAGNQNMAHFEGLDSHSLIVVGDKLHGNDSQNMESA